MEDLENVSFRDEAWLSITKLNEDNALEYFSFSPFYERTSNNEILKMQTQYNNLADLRSKLNDMVGIQYVLEKFNDDRSLFIIHRIERHGPSDCEVLAVYYILHGNIYQAPTNYSLYQSRLANSLFYLSESLDMFQERRVYDPFAGFRMKSDFTEEIHENEREKGNEEIKFFYKVLNEFIKDEKLRK
jgi:mediator of RNA polymerase II transcription subunit 6